jgi:Holliday junction resolvase RusA-like endonuclease
MEVRVSIACVARANTRYLSRKFILSPEHRTFKRAAHAELAKLGFPRLTGPLKVEIHTYWPRVRWLDDGGYPLGDVDATAKSTLDALADEVPKGAKAQQLNLVQSLRGVFDDDIRVVELHAFKHFDESGHRVEVTISQSANFVPIAKQKKKQTSSNSPASKGLAIGDAGIRSACIEAGERGPDGSVVKTTRARKHSKLRSARL